MTVTKYNKKYEDPTFLKYASLEVEDKVMEIQLHWQELRNKVSSDIIVRSEAEKAWFNYLKLQSISILSIKKESLTLLKKVVVPAIGPDVADILFDMAMSLFSADFDIDDLDAVADVFNKNIITDVLPTNEIQVWKSILMLRNHYWLFKIRQDMLDVIRTGLISIYVDTSSPHYLSRKLRLDPKRSADVGDFLGKHIIDTMQKLKWSLIDVGVLLSTEDQSTLILHVSKELNL